MLNPFLFEMLNLILLLQAGAVSCVHMLATFVALKQLKLKEVRDAIRKNPIKIFTVVNNELKEMSMQH